MTVSLSLSLKRPKSTRGDSRSRPRSSTLSPPSSSSSSSCVEPFDLSVIVNEKEFDNLDSVQQVIDTQDKRPKKIKFQLNDLPASEEKMSSKLIKGRKRFVTEEGKNIPEALNLSGFRPGSDDNQLLPSPLIRPSFPKSPYPFPAPAPSTTQRSATLLPPNSNPRDKKYSHRRSRSFSELITSSSSITQPWRDRETWLAIHTPSQTPHITQRKGSIPASLEDGAWRARGGGTFFGADMNGPYPSFKVRVKPLSPPTSPRRYFTSKQQDITSEPEELPQEDKTDSSPMEKMIYQHRSHSAWNVGNTQNTSSSPGSSDGEEHPMIPTKYHTSPPIQDDDDDDLLPPLLPRSITRSSSFESTSRNTTPIPWAQRSGTGSNSPGRRTPPKTPSRQNTSPLRKASDDGNQTPKTWRHVDPSPPRSGSVKEKETSPLITPRTPESPTRTISRMKGVGSKKHNIKKVGEVGGDTPLTPSSPTSYGNFWEDVDGRRESERTQQSPSKRFWKALRLASPGRKHSEKSEVDRDSLHHGEDHVSPSKRSGWF
ncbi:hypothetical protein I203_104182 [Kwoniella mangroviensis CBS 8507]|uniref:uncharacterized protein n=1 Tax=Kwoniella mangroviensis CBS 8507 TaxID=1296122 RepID=UPI00080D31D8|nr:uncharacterized protein I203_00872 [Kwoniella mangroviensis CBS 8507]OCF70735.1 hypothetical protein I203_00872 [Kwoniella mangroviensis CBS 8507]